MTTLLSILIYCYRLLKKLIAWGSNPENLAIIKARLEILSLATSVLGQKTGYKAFSDVSNTSISLAKTVADIIDGRTPDEARLFVDQLNKSNKGVLKDLKVGLGDEGVSLSFLGLTGSYNPMTKQAGLSFATPIK